MNFKKISIICLIIVIVVALGVMATYFSNNSIEKTILKIKSEDNLTNGDLFVVKLTNESNVGVANKTINVNLTDSNDNVTEINITTDSNGNANFTINVDSGNFTVNVNFTGDKHYDSSNASQNLTVTEPIIQSDNTQIVSSESDSDYTNFGDSSSEYSSSDDYGGEIVYSTDPNSDKSVLDENGDIDQDLVDKYNREASEKYGPIG